MEQAELKVCRQKASLLDPPCQAHRPQAAPSRQLCSVRGPSALVPLLFLAGSGMMEVELMWLLDFANSTPSACLSFYTPCSLPLGF